MAMNTMPKPAIALFKEAMLGMLRADQAFLASLSPDARELELADRKRKDDEASRKCAEYIKWLDWCVANGRAADGGPLK